ncbi:restriction endonuclease subunit S [Bacillus amyloliquefaciens]|uniref:restriction endonuclease subunit S n=1 Tax=Bacillus amyloliquefaciens TaxID=1390 RepID=UPI0039F6B9D1
MSKNKKTIEELLEEAVVPKEEQTYEVPENWVYFKFTSIFDVQGGTQPPKSQFVDEEREGYVRLVQIRDFSSDKYKTYIPNTQKLRKMKEEDILIARYGASIGRILTGLSGAYNVALAKVVYPKGKVDKKFLFWLLKSEHFQIPLMGISRSAQSGFNKNDLSYFKMPLPPLNEQKRIAEKVEHLLNKIEEAKQLIEEAKKTFELRRAAILDKAFCGELTRKWREENSLEKKEVELINGNRSIESNSPYSIPTTWKWRKLKDVASFKNGFAFKSKDFVEQGIQLVRMGNLYKNDLALDRNPVYMPLDFDEKIIEKYSVKNGDILLSLTGTKYKRDYGYAVRVEGVEKPLLLNQRILSLNPNFMDEYIFYYLQSSVFRDVFFSFETGGVNQGNVGSKAVESILIPIPPLEEAKEIEKMLNNLLKNEKETLKILNVEDKLETLKQATLSKAFRGELGTNDPREENAIELLKEVLQEQVK